MNRKTCSECYKSKPLTSFRFIRKFGAYRKVCKKCEVKLKNKVKRENIAHVKKHGVTKSALKKIDSDANWDALSEARKFIFSTLTTEERESYDNTYSLESNASLIIGLSIPANFLLFLNGFFYGALLWLVWPLVSKFISKEKEKHVCHIDSSINTLKTKLKPKHISRLKEDWLERKKFHSSSEWVALREDFKRKKLKKDGFYSCFYCKKTLREDVTVDHIKPRSKYPELQFEVDNLVISCRSCNSSKGTKELEDFLNTL